MGRGYMVDEAVQSYLSSLCSLSSSSSSSPSSSSSSSSSLSCSPLTGLLIGQSSAQRDFVVMATRTPQREECSLTAGSQDRLDMEWIDEHARQVSRMLPGGLSVLGVFYISDNEAKDILLTLRQLVFAVQKSISGELLWVSADDDSTEWVSLHVNSGTRKTFCRTFDVKDPKSTAKPAEWRYQSGVCGSWPMVWSSVEVEIPVSLPRRGSTLEDLESPLEEGLRFWSQQIERGTFLLDGRKIPEDTDLTAGQTKWNVKQTLHAQILTTPVGAGEHGAQLVLCGGRVMLRGAVHARAYLHGNKPSAKLAEKVLKRDLVSTVAVRVYMVMEELRAAQETQERDRLSLPRRVLFPLQGVCVCDYQFGDEGLEEVVDRLKEILDLDTKQEDLDTTQEVDAVSTQTQQLETEPRGAVEARMEPQKKSYLGVAMATTGALLAAAVSLLYLGEQ